MKKIALVAILLFPLSLWSQFNVTFSVDMNMETVSPNGVHVMGNFSDPNDDGTDENPGLLNWDPTAYEMTDADMDGIFEYTFSLAEGVYEFKYINGNDGASEETVPDACIAEEDTPYRQIGITEDQSSLVVYGSCGPAGFKNARFQVDANFIHVPESGMMVHHVDGSFNVTNYPLFDYNEDKIWEGTISFDPLTFSDGSTLEYNLINGVFFEEVIDELPCVTGGKRTALLTQENTVIPIHCWRSCDACLPGIEVTFELNMVNEWLAAEWAYVFGDFFSSGGDSLYNRLVDPDEDKIFTQTFVVQPGFYGYYYYNGDDQLTIDTYHQDESFYDLSACPRTFFVENEPLIIQNCFRKCETSCEPGPPEAPITFQIDMNTYEYADQIIDLYMKCSFVPFSLDGIQPIILNDEDGDNIYTITLNVSGEETIYFMTYPDLVDDNLEFEFSESGIADCVQSYPLTTSLPNFRTYNRTGLPETLHIIYNSCEIYTGAEDYGIVDGNIFVDTNQDGEFNGTDFPASNISVLYDETNLGDITGNSGVFLFDTAIGDHEFTVQLPENFICTTGNEVMNATVISGSNNHLDSVGIYSDILIPQFETSIHAVITCSESGFYIIGLTNTGMFPFDAIVELTIDPAVIFDASELPVDSIVGNTYFMTWESLNPFEYNEIYFYVIWPNFELMGVPLTSTLNICTVGGVTCMQETWTSPVLCAYDPNDKSVTPAGWTDAGYILNGTELEYLVRFQNTGNAPATNVRIEDVLDTDLDWTSLHIIGSSHTLTEFEINEDGRAKFFFDGIMLPDSTSDEVGSHGYVLFRIMPDENLPVFTEIENTSEIYFDFNPAVITNTVHNTIFDCSLMTTDIVMEAAACVGELYIQNQPVEYAENYTWTLEDNVVDTNEVLNYQTSEPGTLNFQFEASNPLCAVNFNFPVNVHALPSVPTITQNGNELVATSGGMFYVWYLNDELISQGTSNSFVASESGIYTVSITNEFGCSTLSESVSIAVGISELNALQWSVSPNPATTQITVQCAFAGKKSITLYNALNQIVYTSSMFTNTFVLERNDLPAGVYYLDLVVEGAQISDSKKIIFE